MAVLRLRQSCVALAVSLGYLWTVTVGAQAPAKKEASVEERSSPGGTMLQQQQRTNAAYRALEQAKYQSKLYEQEYVNASDAYRAAQQHADTLKGNLEKLSKAREAAREKEAAAAKVYNNELNAGGAR